MREFSRLSVSWQQSAVMGRDVSVESSHCSHTSVYPLRPSLFPHVPPYVKFIPVSGSYEFEVEPPEEMKEMLWMVPSAPWHTIATSAELNGFTLCEVNLTTPVVTQRREFY